MKTYTEADMDRISKAWESYVQVIEKARAHERELAAREIAFLKANFVHVSNCISDLERGLREALKEKAELLRSNLELGRFGSVNHSPVADTHHETHSHI